MGKINGCLKCLFVFFNVIYAILGCVLTYGLLKITGYSQQISMVGGPSLAWGWVFAIGVLGISCLGIYAGISEKGLIIKIFAGFMVAGMVVMMIIGIIVVVERNQIKEQFDSASSELAESLMANDEIRAELEELQRTTKCCGVVSYKDWGGNIPDSCSCGSGYGSSYNLGSGCKARPQGTSGPSQIYSQTCGDFIYSYVHLMFQGCMAFCFGLAVTALFGLLISILMIHQVRRHDGTAGFPIAMKGF